MKTEKRTGRAAAFAIFLGCVSMAGAQAAFAEETAAVEMLPQAAGNLLWTLIGGILVMFMQPGFALVECGLTRAKNAANIMMKNFIDFSMGVPLYFLLGFGLMFGASYYGLIGTSLFALESLDPRTSAGQWGLTFWFFQCMFAATSATIVSGAVAERMHFTGYLIASALVSGLIYPVSGSWIWNGLYGGSGGWLENMGFVDFAGSTVVHSVGAWIGLAGAMIIGARTGKYGANNETRTIQGHNLPMAGLGVFILWFAWFGFNCASTTAVDGAIGYIAANTCLAAAAGFLSAMITIWIKTGKPDPSMSFNGCLAGLVGITAGCFEISPAGSLAVGALSGILVVVAVIVIDQKLKIDDPVGAISVHGVCGAFGTLAVGLFAAPEYGELTGLLYGGGIRLLLIQALGAGVVFCWAFGCGCLLFTLLKKCGVARVSVMEEAKGLDQTEHSTEAYHGFQIFYNE